ncbi:hypothetical protein J4N42_22025 [Vibrio sp. SCSIO 43135]|uniref:hypothetical protein n=1 Tax=Vibrio sp. SCSIO 43135 TaxID=2819096 RepID=UPI00207657AA|nr:hypothetical protein [Vibrio sp. SCSIO 43135]USD43270.1 hypothetical protein J4N42_22025 [Vibrio sp. SCSIO 43135]
MKKSLLTLALSSIVLVTGCSSTDSADQEPPTRKEEIIAQIQEHVEEYGFDPLYGKQAPGEVHPDNPIRDTETIDAIKDYVKSLDLDYGFSVDPANPVMPDNPSHKLDWEVEHERTEREGLKDKPTEIYGIYVNGVRVAEIEMKDGSGFITTSEHGPDAPLATIEQVDDYNAYYIDGINGDEAIIAQKPDGEVIIIDGERIRNASIDRNQVKHKVQQTKQKIKANRLKG